MFSLPKTSHFYKWLVSLFYFGLSSFCFAGGITLDSTRIIYPQESKQITTSIRNTSDKSAFLIQTWIEDANGNKINDFISTPPLFTSAPRNENHIRLVYAGEKLPTDKESLFYFNVKAIPSIDRNELADKNALILAAVTRVKLFARPKGLKITSKEAVDLIRFSKIDNKKIKISNPSPYYMTLTDLRSGNHELPSTMIAPFSHIDVNAPAGFDASKLTFSSINDFGGITSPKPAIFN
ncbi:Chaperone protein focC precursor [Providencia rustigianii]|uniref:Gram-negative pili assembly chaperone domain protein n=6 Tax=Providencia rustigianii TaxID=158850 RepID=D1P617_9GAMM|nr:MULTISPECIES: fimbria/pilus periplasmic chaperone [Providencia]EFB71140.1 gram-negative pili assembly chaperone domain protein [Providencia rustigianii DSM 4541]MTC58329.1 fimbria/pilus periplasmic chaperone [Providencia rustigianii]SUC25944.1 Chaperone protein focC precursor [Providencia rustigianii]VEB64163.1 Chaperone protein focC precursor [Providencia rustigianii]